MTLDIATFYADQTVQDMVPDRCQSLTTVVSNRNFEQFREEKRNDHNDEERWENEGGAHLARFGLVPGISRLIAEDDAFVTRIINFDDALDREDYDTAAEELLAAARIYTAFQSIVTHCFDDAISHLTTIGGPASPPHPLALPLIRKRNAYAI